MKDPAGRFDRHGVEPTEGLFEGSTAAGGDLSAPSGLTVGLERRRLVAVGGVGDRLGELGQAHAGHGRVGIGHGSAVVAAG